MENGCAPSRGRPTDNPLRPTLTMSPLQIVHLEGSVADAAVVRAELERSGFDCAITHAQTEEEFVEALGDSEIDLILAESSVPGFDGMQALALAHAQAPGVPFIFVVESNPNEGIATLHAGASDFVLKEYPAKLGPAVRRALNEARAQRDLQKTRRDLVKHAELLDLASDAIIICDAAGVITYWNNGAERIYGWGRDDALGQNVDELLKTRAAETLGWLKATFRAEDHWEGELWQTRKDGVEIVVASSWTLTDTKPDAPWLQINADVTDRVRAAESLRRSEERYRRFVDEDLTGNLIMKPDGAIVACNPAFARIFGFDSIEEAQQANFLSLLRTKKEGLDLLAEVRPNESVERDELEMHQRDGDAVYVAARFTGSFDAEGNPAELKGYLFNDTKRKRLEQQLIQAQKMEGLGTLAGGIAHDFNNILAIIHGYTTRIEEAQGQPGPDFRRHPGHSRSRRTRRRARAAAPHFRAPDRGAVCRARSQRAPARDGQHARGNFPEDDQFRPQPAGQPPDGESRPQPAPPGPFKPLRERARRDADGGTITLESTTIPGAELGEHFTGVKAERYACVRVIDTGTGISKQVKPHIFEPFYTTKERSKGTGLGLSVVYGVVDNHRGFVQVDSEPGYGTTFSVYLPLEHAAESAALEGQDTPDRPNEPGRTIMLVEDEEMLRGLGVLMLEGDGYRVLAAKDGAEAVEMFSAHKDEIGLVLCDLGLPKLGGREVFLRMKEMKPNVRAIVASGYLEPHVRSEILKAGVLDTIQKPYDFREMLVKIRSIIGQPNPDDDQPQLF